MQHVKINNNKMEYKYIDIMDFGKIERKWQKRWEERKVFRAKEGSKKKKYYVLEMYPYPSASFLHMGHVRNYTIGDVYARFKRMQGFNVLYPMGYDSFGLPAETAAKKEGIHPKKYSENAIRKIMEYQKSLGNSYDWGRVLWSHSPDYYRWNQFFFLKMLEKGLAYRKKAPVNWCQTCESVLANEEAEGGRCWRCGKEVVKKDMEQWFLKITAYADRLLEDLKKIDWPEKIKKMQADWIGRSEGVEINFKIDGETWPVFTTRPDTIFGVTFMVISAQHPRLMEIVTDRQREAVQNFVGKCNKARTREDAEDLDKDGIFTGSYAVNHVTNERVPVYTGNFVLADYGSGMVMAVPAHDQRDFEFAKKYGIKIKIVIQNKESNLTEKIEKAYTDDGILVCSQRFNGINSKEAIKKVSDYIEKQKIGKKTTNYKIRDWMISRQRYWGTPIPVIYCNKCGTVPEKELPVLLPGKVDFTSKTNPLMSNKEFFNAKCPKCKGNGKRETDTMGGFVDSSWYFLRYCDNKNKQKPFDPKKVRYLMPVDQYIGGAEHAVMHLIYARFFVKVLKDLGIVGFDEPFTRLFNQGILYKDGHKMSKSFGNIVTQDEIAKKYGIDTARLFLMFVSSPDKQMEWSEDGVEGAYRIIKRVIRLKENLNREPNSREESKINITIKKVTENIESFDYPKAIVSIIEALDYFSAHGISKESYGKLLQMFSLFCPHIAEELWELLGNVRFISASGWPELDESCIDEKSDKLELLVKQTLEDTRNIVKMLGKPAKKAIIYVAPEWKHTAYNCILEHAKDPDRIIPSLMKKPELRRYGNEIVKFAGRLKKEEIAKLGKIPDEKEELSALSESKGFFEKELGCRVEITEALKSGSERAKRAEPGKPGIEVVV